IELARAVDEMKPQAQNDYGESQQEAAYDLAMQIMQSYYEAMAGMMKDRARTEMLQGGGAGAGVQKQWDSLRQKMRAEQNRFRKETKRHADELVKHYEDELKKLEMNNESIQRRREELIEEVRSLDNTTKLLKTQLTDEKVKNRKLSAQLKRVAKQKAQKKDLLQNYKEMQDIRKEKESIVRTANRLIPMIDNPTNKKHVPESMREPLAQFLLGIDFVPHRAKDESANTKHWTQNMQRLANFLTKMNEHQEEDAAGISFVMDPQLTEAINDFISRNSERQKVSLLPANELHELATIMRSISSLVTRTNEAFMSERGETIAQIGGRTISEARKYQDKLGRLPENVDNLLNVSMLDARTFFEETAGMEIYDALHEGQNIRARDIKKAGEYASELVKDKGINKWRNDEHIFHTTDGDLTLTTGQIMSLYRLMEREQAKEHITIGGIKQGEIKESGLKKAIDRMSGKKDQKRPVHITGDQIAQIVDTLTPEQKQIADELQKYMADECAKDGNEVTMRMYGYRKFTDKNYFPIRVDSNSTATTDRNRTGGNVSMNAVINMSMTKNVTPHARNAVMIDDIFSVYVNHCVDMATYHGMAMPLADALRWFNYQEISEGSTEDGSIMYAASVKEEIERLMGRDGKKFFENLLEDLNGMSSRAHDDDIADKLTGAYKAAAVGANLRVAIQQPTSYLRASMAMDPKYLLKAMGS
ncbi:MAG: hypothetical protein IJV04_03345, partial [Lachnospiraceae bacterium]|nr:hypothetical protein [Lachnospiraceae bacterium]